MIKHYALWLHLLPITKKKKKDLFTQFSSCEQVFHADETHYNIPNLKQEDKVKIKKAKLDTTQIDKVISNCQTFGIEIITIEDKFYPLSLKEIEDAPIVLFVKGNPAYLKKSGIAIVGARKCSDYGYHTAYAFGKELAQLGLNVISGMASGIDAAAHEGALQGGITLAVLGCGIDVCYPKENGKIYKEIPQKGCLISEYPPGTTPLPYYFPERNRIISGLSSGILIVEAAQKSGSLITADLGLMHNREVFAVPGDISRSLSMGTNTLIKQGAKLVQNVQDIWDELPDYVLQNVHTFEATPEKSLLNTLDKVEIIVYDCLSWQPVTFEQIIAWAEMPIIELSTVLLRLEIKGLIQRLPGERYVRVN
jgi:DNA processing protein